MRLSMSETISSSSSAYATSFDNNRWIFSLKQIGAENVYLKLQPPLTTVRKMGGGGRCGVDKEYRRIPTRLPLISRIQRGTYTCSQRVSSVYKYVYQVHCCPWLYESLLVSIRSFFFVSCLLELPFISLWCIYAFIWVSPEKCTEWRVNDGRGGERGTLLLFFDL